MFLSYKNVIWIKLVPPPPSILNGEKKLNKIKQYKWGKLSKL